MKRTASDLSTIQFRLIFKGHKSLEYCCLVIPQLTVVIHLTSVSTISYAESNGGIFIVIAPLGTVHFLPGRVGWWKWLCLHKTLAWPTPFNSIISSGPPPKNDLFQSDPPP